ncbi:MAG TPA: metalloregulator ArsR/SmtB family transcription factor [Candidatus Dormibacteraeota bacterium]|jgi:DNA-binding transcriptional ArsR family regulator|nr:metalloregulator ArsR/SmtB family transcription factor [Candidatus Dormibacteraeota bacterium]
MKAAMPKGDPFDALGNSYRRAIVELLAGKPRSVQEIADRLPISRPAVSRHLRLLNKAGLVADEQIGARRLYRLDEDGAEVARKYLSQVWGHVGTRFRLFAENTKPAKARR